MMTMHDVESHRPPRARQLDRRSALLAALRGADEPQSVEAVARAAGIAASTAQFHLSILVSSGEAVRTPARTGAAGRPSWRYAAAPEPASRAASARGQADSYQELARVLAAQLDGGRGAAAVAREAGRRWADAVPAETLTPASSPDAAQEQLARVLGGLGFAPEPGRDTDEILLRACPFEAVAREHRAVVCGVHLGLVERTAAAIGGGIAVAAFEPFRQDQPLACAVRLAKTP